MSTPTNTDNTPSYYLPATIALVSIVEGQALSVQSLLDLAAVSRPSTRPDWSDLLVECAAVQRHMAMRRWIEMGTAIITLTFLMGAQLKVEKMADLIQFATDRARRDGPQCGFAAMVHHLCVLAVQ